MHSSSQLAPTGAYRIESGTRRRDNCPAYALPRVRELPLRLQSVSAASFGGLITSHPASRAVPATNHPRGALS